MTEREVSSERVREERLKLWFFRDLSSEQRLKLFGLLGMPVEEIGHIHGHQTQALRHVLLALRSSVKPVGVKKLEWVKHPTVEAWRADTMLGTYQVWMGSIGTSWQFDSLLGEHLDTKAGDEHSAKSAAQADYERRVLSALEAPSPQEAPSEVTDEMVQKAWEAYDAKSGYSKPERFRSALTAALKGDRP